MKSLLKFALFCLLFLSFSQVGFGQVDENAPEGNQKTTSDEQPYLFVETTPRFPGDQEGLMEYLKINLRYPQKAMQNDITGTVLLQFDVLSTGEVANVKVKKGVHRLLDKEAVRLIKSMPKWQPGTQNGKPVKVTYDIPLHFNRKSNSTTN